MTQRTACAVEGCDSVRVYARGWCWRHYKRWLKAGVVSPAKPRSRVAEPTPHDELLNALYRTDADTLRAERYYEQNMAQAAVWRARWEPNAEYLRQVALWRGTAQVAA